MSGCPVPNIWYLIQAQALSSPKRWARWTISMTGTQFANVAFDDNYFFRAVYVMLMGSRVSKNHALMKAE